jgi:hypothetical protein
MAVECDTLDKTKRAAQDAERVNVNEIYEV